MNSSLRLRLVAIILGPLLVIAALVIIWAVYDAQNRASERFDRSLLSAVLAVSRDVASSGGDALTPQTNAILRDTSGGRVFYHVYAPDGVFVTGFATPPVPEFDLDRPESPQGPGQHYFDSVYQGSDVRALRFVDAMQIDGLAGDFTFTVWQDTELRLTIVHDLLWRTFLVMSSLVITVALVVWFGVRIGLRPLLSLENAIARRSPEDLSPIQRQVPIEATGIVSTLNRLLVQVTSTLTAKDVFVSNAAHQLRNPIAGVVAMSEAVASAKSFDQMRDRSVELVTASREIGDLANKLLTLERARAPGDTGTLDRIDAARLLEMICKRHQAQANARGVALTCLVPPEPVFLMGDATMLGEAVTNLIENAFSHAGNALTSITAHVQKTEDQARISIVDDGQGIPPELFEKARERFGQAAPSSGSGLGLAIADAVAEQHGGRLQIETANGLIVRLLLPLAHAPHDDVSASTSIAH